MWKRTVCSANAPLCQTRGMSASIEEFKSPVEYAGNMGTGRSMYM